MKEPKENFIEWLEDSERVTVTLSRQKYINTVLGLADLYPEEVEIKYLPKSNGGYLVAHLPLKYIKICHPRVLTEETKEKLSTRMKSLPSKRKEHME